MIEHFDQAIDEVVKTVNVLARIASNELDELSFFGPTTDLLDDIVTVLNKHR